MIPERDPLSEVLDAFPLPTKFAGRIELTTPWGLSVPERVAAVCAVKNAQSWLTVAGAEQPIRVAAGDVIALSPVCGHELRDTTASPVVPIDKLVNCARVRPNPAPALGEARPNCALNPALPTAGKKERRLGNCPGRVLPLLPYPTCLATTSSMSITVNSPSPSRSSPSRVSAQSWQQ